MDSDHLEPKKIRSGRASLVAYISGRGQQEMHVHSRRSVSATQCLSGDREQHVRL